MPSAARSPQPDRPADRNDEILERADTAVDRALGAVERADAAPDFVQPAGTRGEATVADYRPSREDVAREAYLIYLANGSQDGRADEDWYAAEARLLGDTSTRQSNATPQQAAAQLDAVNTRDRTPG
jgi:hypothetical protein